MGGCTSPYEVLAEDDLPVVGLESRKIPDPSERSLSNLFSPNHRKFGSRRHKRQHTASTFYPVSDLHLQTGGGVKKNIHSRAELDQSDSLSAFYPIACFFREHNPTRQKPRDLLERYSLSFAFDFDDVLFILFRGSQIHGVPELSRLIADFPDYPSGRRTVHMNIENVKKNTDACSPGAVVSPADGKVTGIWPVTENGVRQTRISIFLNVFDVHVNRSPTAGIIREVRYQTGKFGNAMNLTSAEQNEQNIVKVEGEGQRVTFKQIAGLLARRIVFTKKAGDRVERGERVGLIKFGSRVDVFLDSSASLQVKIGDRVKGGSSVLALMPPAPELAVVGAEQIRQGAF